MMEPYIYPKPQSIIRGEDVCHGHLGPLIHRPIVYLSLQHISFTRLIV